MTEKLIPLDLLASLTSQETIASARRAMDAQSVTGFHLDARGRIEGGVRPAPPSTEPPAFARITRRGSRIRIECRKHGRDTWCLHAVILALHHIGVTPIFRVAEAPKAPEITVGFQCVVAFDAEGMTLKIRGRSGPAFIHNPGRFLQREYAALGLDASGAACLQELGASEGDALRLAGRDASEAMEALRRVPLYQQDGAPWQIRPFKGTSPRALVRISNGMIHWRIDPKPADGTVFLPGWPGYLVVDTLLLRVNGYLSDFQTLCAASSPLPLDSDLLLTLMRDKHGVHWESPRPAYIADMDGLGLNLNVAGRDLEGTLGLHHGEHFFPLTDTHQRRQVLSAGGRVAVLDTNDHQMGLLRRQVGQARLPLTEGAAFHLREHAAPGFLEHLQAPDVWQVSRSQADRHFGLIREDLHTHWENGMPRYSVNGESFTHGQLTEGLLDNGRGTRLPDGRLLNINITELLKNQYVMRGVSALHDSPDMQQDLLARLDKGEKGAPGPAPAEAWLTRLRPYQTEGVRWMTGNLNRNEPALLADDMGLGKTVQALAMLDGLRTEDAPQLIVVPTSLLANWKEEADRFCPERTVTVHHGPKRTREAETLASADLVLTSYGTLLRDIDMLYDVCFDVVVLDEAQAIKNAASRTAAAVRELWCNKRVAMTGTPVENRMTELWAIFHFLAPGYLGEEEEARLVTQPGTPAYAALKAKVVPFLLRRTKEEVAKELPAKQETVVLLPMEAEQEAVYQRYRSQSLEAVREDGKAGTLSILTRLLRLRQACCHPGLLDDALGRGPSNKLNWLIDHLKDVIAARHGALVFSQFTKLLALVRYALEEAEIPYLYLDGRTKDRQALVHRFQAGEAPVFLISLKAGGVGLNLTRASYVYHLDPWWNPAVEAQATDRAHRIGQEKKVFSYKLISQGTVEERILRLQAGKKFLSEGLWTDAGPTMDRESLLALLQ